MNYLNYIVNASQLAKTLDDILETVLDDVSKTMLEDFRNHLEHTVYAPSESTYKRYYAHGGFYSGWQIEDSEKYVKKLMFDGNKLIAPSQDMKNSQMSHGGRDGEDIRDIMAVVLNDARYNDYYSYNGGAQYLQEQGEGYWDSYLDTIDKKINQWLDNTFKKYNVVRR